jgi:hypothetical protein
MRAVNYVVENGNSVVTTKSYQVALEASKKMGGRVHTKVTDIKPTPYKDNRWTKIMAKRASEV